MAYEKLIHEYLDTGLDAGREEELFAALSQSPELRNEFNMQMKLNSVAKKDLNSITPPVDVTNNVFAGLGFSIPDQIQEESALTRFFTSKKFGVLLALLLLFSVSTWYSFDQFIAGNDFDSNGNTNQSIERNSNVPIVSSIEQTNNQLEKNSLNSQNSTQIATSSLPENKNSNTTMERNNKTNNVGDVKSQIFENNNKNNELAYNTNDINAKEINQKSTSLILMDDEFDIQNRFSNNSVVFNQTNSMNPGNSFIEPSYDLNEDSYKRYFDNTKWQLNIVGFNNSSNLANNVATDAGTLLHTGAELFYKVNYSNWIGLEIGYDNFPQEFQYSDQLNYAQNPSLVWWGLSYKYRPDYQFFYEIAQPFVKFTVGGTEVGALGRIQSGLQLRMYNNINFLVGFDASRMYYNVQGDIYNTDMFGLVYGVGFNF